MRRLRELSFAAALAICAAPAQAATIDVAIDHFAFEPREVTIDAGDTVRWTNAHGTAHTVTSDTGGDLDSGTLTPARTYSFTFDAAGTFAYHCSIHPFMTASVVVRTPPPPVYAISGQVTGPAAPGTGVDVEGPVTRTATTAADGTYRIGNLPQGAYTVRPWRPLFAFTPVSRPVDLAADAAGVDFASSPAAAVSDALAVFRLTIRLPRSKEGRDSLSLRAVFVPDPAARFPDPSAGDTLMITIGDFYGRTFAAPELRPNKSGRVFSSKDATTRVKLRVRSAAAGSSATISLRVKAADLRRDGPVNPVAPHTVTVRLGPHEASGQ